MKNMIPWIFLALAVIFAIAAIACYVHQQPPMKGYIDGKTYHPAYFPADQNTPWVYCLSITSTDGCSACSWKVDKETYDSYNIGDLTGKPSNVQDGGAY